MSLCKASSLRRRIETNSLIQTLNNLKHGGLDTLLEERSSLLDHRVWMEQEFLWLGCIFSNAPMIRITLAQRKILTCVWRNINQEKAQDIYQEGCQSSLFMAKNTTESPMLIIARSKFKTGAGRREKH